MAVEVQELWGQRFGNERGERFYLVTGTDDAGAARNNLPDGSWGDLIATEIEVEEIPNRDAWLGFVRYQSPDFSFDPPEVGSSSFSFDTSGGTQHITQSLSTTNKYAPTGATAPDFQGAIGATTDSVEGTDIVVPVYSFAETHYLDVAVVTGTYKAALFHLTGKVNNATFKGFEAGECLFLGASGSLRGGGDDWEITYRFAASPNADNLTVGPITGIEKKGWEYLWVRYQDVESENVLAKQPLAAYVEQVYRLADFSALGIGV